jgi:hypothetical protein
MRRAHVITANLSRLSPLTNWHRPYKASQKGSALVEQAETVSIQLKRSPYDDNTAITRVSRPSSLGADRSSGRPGRIADSFEIHLEETHGFFAGHDPVADL